MPTNLRRFSIAVPEDLEEKLVADAKANYRTIANQILWLVYQGYASQEAGRGKVSSSDRRKEIVFGSRKPRPRAAAGA